MISYMFEKVLSFLGLDSTFLDHFRLNRRSCHDAKLSIFTDEANWSCGRKPLPDPEPHDKRYMVGGCRSRGAQMVNIFYLWACLFCKGNVLKYGKTKIIIFEILKLTFSTFFNEVLDPKVI